MEADNLVAYEQSDNQNIGHKKFWLEIISPFQ